MMLRRYVHYHNYSSNINATPSVNYTKTGLTNYSSFLVWSGLEKGITYECDHYGAVNNHFPVF